MLILYITWVIQQKLKFCSQGIVHMNFLKTSVQAEIDIRMISTTYIAFIGKKWKNMSLSSCLDFPETPTWSNEG